MKKMNTNVLKVASVIAGGDDVVVADIQMEEVAEIVTDLKNWKRFNRSLGMKWVPVTIFGLETMTLEYAFRQKHGLAIPQDRTWEMHKSGLIWMLRKLGQLEKALQTAPRQMALLHLSGKRALDELKVSYVALPGTVANNDNQPREGAGKRLH